MVTTLKQTKLCLQVMQTLHTFIEIVFFNEYALGTLTRFKKKLIGYKHFLKLFIVM